MTDRSILLPGAARRALFGLIAGLLAVVALAVFGGSTGRQRREAVADETPGVVAFADIPPLAYLIKRVGGRHVNVGVLVQPGQDPHTFEPTPGQVSRMAQARLLFQVGLPFEEQIAARIAKNSPQLQVIDVTRGIRKRWTAEECHDAGHDEADHDEDSHEGGPDPHVWLSPALLKTMAVNIEAALVEVDPARAADYRRNLAELTTDLDALDARIRQALASCRGRTFYVFHPSFGYFADEYGLVQKAVEVEGKSPTPRQLSGLVAQARADGVKTIFLQPRFDPKAARAVARAMGGVVVPLDPLAEDVVANLGEVARQIAAGMEKQ
jgi:zinc transport system substrate-binding protein